MKNVTTPISILLILIGLGVLGSRALNNNRIETYQRTFNNNAPQQVQLTLTEGSLLKLSGAGGTHLCPWYVQRNAALNLPGVKDLTISDGRTTLQIDGRNLLTKNLPAVDDPALVSNQKMMQAVFDERCNRALIVSNAKLHPLWGK